jgi:hypothetical protein
MVMTCKRLQQCNHSVTTVATIPHSTPLPRQETINEPSVSPIYPTYHKLQKNT